MKNLLILCPYPEGVAPSQRFKYEQYFTAFKDDGWEVTVEPFIQMPFWKIIYAKGNLPAKTLYTLKGYLIRIKILFKVHRFDVVYVHLWGTPFGPPLYERILRHLAKKIIYDIDDLVYLKETKSKAHPIVDWFKGKEKPIYLMQKSDHVITCTPYLDKFVKKYNSNTTDISSTVDTDVRYRHFEKQENDIITIGWSGSVTTAKYFYLLKDIFLKLKQKYDYNIKVMGDENIVIPGLNIEALPWNESYEIEVLRTFDIGVYPLPDEEWVYGKSGLKAIQYMALGIPTVASAIGANYRVIDHEVSGFLVKDEEEWVAVISKLIEDADLRKSIGRAARKKVEENFSTRVNKEKYLKILNTV